MLKKIKIIFDLLEWVVFVFLLGILAIILSPSLPFKNIPKTYVVVSGSMEPTIKTGSVVFVKSVDSKTVKKGDIIAFTSPSDPKSTILHRVDSISSTNPLLFKTKGDNNNTTDAWDVMDVGVKGVYISAIPYLGHAAAFVRTPLGFGLTIGIPALLFIISQIIIIKKTINSEVDKQVKKRISQLTIFLFLVPSVFSLLSGVKFARALFTDQVTVSGLTLMVKDFVPPTVPQNLRWTNPDVACGGSTNSYTITADWDNATDNLSVVKYEYQIIYPRPSGGFGVWNTFVTPSSYSGVFNQAQGRHIYKVRAYDAEGNISDWSDDCSITYDTTPPNSVLDDLPMAPFTNPTILTYTATDNFAVDHTDLCYSFNLGPWACGDYFNFDFPQGQGIYHFDTIAVDRAGNTEKFINNDYAYIIAKPEIFYDITPPTTNLIVNPVTPSFTGQNLLSDTDWSFSGNSAVDGSAIRLGQGTLSSIDSIYQSIFIPQNLSANLFFSYQFSSDDIADYDFLTVGVSSVSDPSKSYNIFNFGNMDPENSLSTSWQTLSHSLSYWAGETINLIFSLTNTDELATSVLLDDIKISTLDTRVGDTLITNFLATDLGSGIFSSPSSMTLSIAENTLSYNSIDNLGNIEINQANNVVVLPPIVLNLVTSNKIALFNNDLVDSIDLANYSYSINLGSTIAIGSTIISPQSTVDLNLISPLPDSFQISLFKDGLQIDSTTVTALGTASWQRQQNGLGPWIKVGALPSFNLEPRLNVGKVTLTVSGIAPTLPDMTYKIEYTTDSLPQEIVGQIFADTINSQGSVSRDFFLGTCSEGGVCTLPSNIGSTFKVTFSTLLPTIFTF